MIPSAVDGELTCHPWSANDRLPMRPLLIDGLRSTAQNLLALGV
jgi:hypothetical protein